MLLRWEADLGYSPKIENPTVIPYKRHPQFPPIHCHWAQGKSDCRDTSDGALRRGDAREILITTKGIPWNESPFMYVSLSYWALKISSSLMQLEGLLPT